jgi:hypothetical protein
MCWDVAKKRRNDLLWMGWCNEIEEAEQPIIFVILKYGPF